MKKEYLFPIGIILIALGLIIFRQQIFTQLPNIQKHPVSSTPATTSPDVTHPAELSGTTWLWEKTIHADGTIVKPVNPSDFSMRLGDGEMSSSTDCNTVRSTYIVSDEVISFGPLTTTEMYCEGSLEASYTSSFPLVTSYTIQDGSLTMILIKDLGTMHFSAVH